MRRRFYLQVINVLHFHMSFLMFLSREIEQISGSKERVSNVKFGKILKEQGEISRYLGWFSKKATGSALRQFKEELPEI